MRKEKGTLMGRAYAMELYVVCTNCSALGIADKMKVMQLLESALDADTGAAKAALAGPHYHSGDLTDLAAVAAQTARDILGPAAPNPPNIDTRFEWDDVWNDLGGGNHDGRLKGERDYGSGYEDWTYSVSYNSGAYEGQVWLTVVSQPG